MIPFTRRYGVIVMMSSEDILQTISDLYSPLSEACRKDMLSHFKYMTYKKGEIVVREGQYSNKAFLIIKGCSRAYYLKEGKDISDWFAF